MILDVYTSIVVIRNIEGYREVVYNGGRLKYIKGNSKEKLFIFINYCTQIY